MLNGKRVIAVIPARGGSKSVPGKNVRPLAGTPLIGWSILTAKQVKQIDRVIVSTDDGQIARVSRQFSAEVYPRPAELATDESLVIDALKDLLLRLKDEQETAEVLVILEPTCPFRSVADVEACVSLLSNDEYDCAATFTTAELNPHRAWKINGDAPEVFIPGAIPWLPRQQLPEAYQLNGAVYALRIEGLMASSQSILYGRIGAVKMPRDRSIDINDPIDFLLAEQFAARISHA